MTKKQLTSEQRDALLDKKQSIFSKKDVTHKKRLANDDLFRAKLRIADEDEEEYQDNEDIDR